MTRFETILCPIDLAAPSEIALDHAIALGEWSAAEVTVLAIRPHGGLAGRMSRAGWRGSPSAEHAPALAERIRQVSGRAVSVEEAEGAVGRETVRAAGDLRADLIVMAARQTWRIERLLFGSVTEHVLMRTRCPVLIVPPGRGPAPSPPAALFERIVCGVDRSLESHRGLAYALALGGCHLTLAHALEDFADEDPRFAGHFNSAACWREVEPDIRAEYERLVPEEARLWCAIDVVVTVGRAESVLIEAAKARRASLMVIGTAGMHLPVGTTARHVIERAPCPVLAVPRAPPRADGPARSATPALP